jgi:multiple sugar transport system permease protein
MPIIGHVGRRSFKVRALNLAIHIVLVLGGITMVYPFLVMISGSLKGKLDRGTMDVVPEYLRESDALYRRYIESKYNERVQNYLLCARVRLFQFDKCPPLPEPNAQRVADWREFLRSSFPDLPFAGYDLAHAAGDGIACKLARDFRAELRAEPEVGDRLPALNARYGVSYVDWNQVVPTPHNALAQKLKRESAPNMTPYGLRQARFIRAQPPDLLNFSSLDAFFVESALRPRYGLEIAKLNAALNTRYASWEEIYLPRALPPEGHPLRADWIDFVRRRVCIELIEVDPAARPAWQAMLRAKYAGDLRLLSARHEMPCGAFDEIPLADPPPAGGFRRTDWADFIASADPAHLRLRSIEFMYRDHLRAKYRTVEELNRAHALAVASFDDVPLPTLDVDADSFRRAAADWRAEFLTRNYRMVLDVMWRNGYAFRNTILYCALAVIAALIINPMAAYALSRYKLPVTYKVLLFMMLPMAFPPMVLGIPQFLMIRNLNLLNTFAALILPGLASGYSIFLLKGFFDSLPRELYESAQIDGAGEWTMFWQITMAASKPILAVIALGAFTAAYGNFMMAFILCQDPGMWTLMVHLYQLQQYASPAVTYAALIVASVPTFIVFVFCQNIIIRGIVVPTEK